MIIFKNECMLEDFNAWSGGKDVLNAILEHEEKDSILALLTDIINGWYNMDDFLTETQVNDLLWFDAVDIIEDCLGISLFD